MYLDLQYFHRRSSKLEKCRGSESCALHWHHCLTLMLKVGLRKIKFAARHTFLKWHWGQLQPDNELNCRQIGFIRGDCHSEFDRIVGWYKAYPGSGLTDSLHNVLRETVYEDAANHCPSESHNGAEVCNIKYCKFCCPTWQQRQGCGFLTVPLLLHYMNGNLKFGPCQKVFLCLSICA